MYAVSGPEPKLRVVELLVAAGADVNATNKETYQYYFFHRHLYKF